MKVQLYSAPAVEPLSLAQAKLHLLLDSETFGGNITLNNCFAAGSHAVANNYTTHVGTGVAVSGKEAVVFLQPVNNGASGTVDVKIQESDDNATWTDWTGGAFTQVTEANDTTIQEKQYTGSKAYIRTAAKVLVAACEFGTSILVNAATTAQDDLLTDLIQTARISVENDTRRALITQVWDYFPKDWPEGDRLKIPFGNLKTVSSVKHKDTAGTETTMTENIDYIVETNGDQCGFLVLPYGCTWPTVTLYPSKPISIRFTCGYGDTGADVPSPAKTAMKMLISKLFENRGEDVVGQIRSEDKTYDRLINIVPRLYDEF